MLLLATGAGFPVFWTKPLYNVFCQSLELMIVNVINRLKSIYISRKCKKINTILNPFYIKMKFLSFDIIDPDVLGYPENLKSITIAMRGTKDLFNMYFSVSDIETSFGITLTPYDDFTWINTPTGDQKYVRYIALKRMMYRINNECTYDLAEQYSKWVESLFFLSSGSKAFFKQSDIDETLSDIDDTEIPDHDDEFLVQALEHKLERLKCELELKKRDIEILNRDLEDRDKTIELLQYRLNAVPMNEWV